MTFQVCLAVEQPDVGTVGDAALEVWGCLATGGDGGDGWAGDEFVGVCGGVVCGGLRARWRSDHYLPEKCEPPTLACKKKTHPTAATPCTTGTATVGFSRRSNSSMKVATQSSSSHANGIGSDWLSMAMCWRRCAERATFSAVAEAECRRVVSSGRSEPRLAVRWLGKDWRQSRKGREEGQELYVRSFRATLVEWLSPVSRAGIPCF